MMRILERKGFVSHRKDGRAFVFHALVDESHARKNAIRHVLDRFFDNSPGTPGAQPAGARGRARVGTAAVARADPAPRVEMTVVWALTWLGQSAALAALTAAFVRLPGCRSSAAARHVAWAAALVPLRRASRVAARGCCRDRSRARIPQSARAGAACGGFARSRRASGVGHPDVLVARLGLGPWRSRGAGVGSARDVWRVVRLKRRTVPLTAEEHARMGSGLSRSTSAARRAWRGATSSTLRPSWDSPVPSSRCRARKCRPCRDEQCHLVVLHELAHVRRGDDWWALAERIIVALAWVNPVVHLDGAGIVAVARDGVR